MVLPMVKEPSTINTRDAKGALLSEWRGWNATYDTMQHFLKKL